MIEPKIEHFKHLPKYSFFRKTIEKIGNEIPKLANESKTTQNKTSFFIHSTTYIYCGFGLKLYYDHYVQK